ncbi:MAG: hypothetical protein ACRDA3_02585 [Peptostreptococcaceae bacterium]
MQDIQIKIDELKSNIINKDLKQLRKNKLKIIGIDKNNNSEDEFINNYNYYIKLTKKIKRYIEEGYEHIVDIRYDNCKKMICLVSKFSTSEMEIEMPIDIRVITGDSGDTYMDCSYYNEEEYGLLFINKFESKKLRCGYGSLILENLDFIVENINHKLNVINLKEMKNFKMIKVVSGKSIPTKSIISQENLNKLYIRYGFEIDNKNNIKKYV